MSQSRLYPERPILAASAAVFRADGRMLLATRTNPPWDHVFSLPGGVVEPGETLAEAAAREVEEETGVRCRVTGFNDWVEFIDRDDEGRVRRHFVIASFIAEHLSGEGVPGPEAGQILWAEPADIEGLKLTPNLGPLLVKARAMLERAR